MYILNSMKECVWTLDETKVDVQADEDLLQRAETFNMNSRVHNCLFNMYELEEFIEFLST